MRWEEGQETLERLVADGELDRVSADLDTARSLLESAQRPPHFGEEDPRERP